MTQSGWRKRLERIIRETHGLTMKEVSLRAGLSEIAVYDILKRGRTPSVDNFRAIANALGVSPYYLLEGEEPPEITIPVVGIVSGGEGWDHASNQDRGTIEFKIGGFDAVAIEIRGDSMTPVYRDGEVVICDRHASNYADNLIGLDCAVLTKDGQGYLKILKRGSKPAHYNLKSFNPLFDDIENVAIEWVAAVTWIRRSHK